MKILLVGGFGFIGRRFIRKFHDKYELVVFGKKSSYKDFRTSTNQDHYNIKIEFGDVTDNIIDVIAKQKPDVVLHLAALTGLPKCEENINEAFRINVLGTYNVIKGCSKSNSRLVFISSREVYGESNELPTKEDDELVPNNVYGITKMLGEKLVTLAHKKNHLKNFVILRLTNLYGPEGDNYGAQIIIRGILSGKVEVWGGKQNLNFVYVDDVVDVIEKSISHSESINDIFNVGSNDNLSIDEFIKIVLKQIDRKVEIIQKPMRKTETTKFIPDMTKLHKTLKIEKKFIDMETGLKKTMDWYS